MAINAAPADYRNIANNMLLKSGVKIGIFFEEYQDYVSVSLRSRVGLRMDILAQSLGGGGHVRASGCKLNCSLKNAMLLVLEKAQEMVELGNIK